jgi:hypothetical protein
LQRVSELFDLVSMITDAFPDSHRTARTADHTMSERSSWPVERSMAKTYKTSHELAVTPYRQFGD